MSLWSISTELACIVNAMEEHGHDSPEVDAALEQHAAALREALSDKADAYADTITALAGRAEARDAEAKRITALASADRNLADRLRQRLLDAMVTTGTQKVETVRHRISVVSNGGALPVEIANPDDLPRQFVVPEVIEKVDKNAIREALLRGENVPGARLCERGRRLAIK